MSDHNPFLQNSSIQRAKDFDALCDEFESQCQAGNRPSIENFLGRVDEVEKQALLNELMAIELHYRRQLGESIDLSEYQRRFPSLSLSQLDETVQHANRPDSPVASHRSGNPRWY